MPGAPVRQLEAPQIGRDKRSGGVTVCGAVARAARREAARAGNNGSTSVEIPPVTYRCALLARFLDASLSDYISI